MNNLNIDDYLKLISNVTSGEKKAPIFVIGAGFSMPSLPSACKLKKEIIKNLLIKSGKLDASEKVLKEIDKNYFTLEVLGGILKYVCRDNFDPAKFWKLLNDSSFPNKATKNLAILKSEGLVGPIITTNFDSFIPDTFDELGIKFNVVTSSNPQDYSCNDENAIVAVHGTCFVGENISDPSTVVSRDFTKPFSPEIYSIVSSLLSGSDRDIIYAGYSGRDIYDMNILLSQLDLDPNSHYWLSYNGNMEDFHRFIGDKFENSLYACKVDELLEGVVRKIRVSKEYTFHDKKVSIPWGGSVANGLSSITKEQSFKILQLVENGSVSAWVSLEHYLLYSIGYDVKSASEMLGEDASFFSLELSSYIQAHEKYWEENFTFSSSEKEVIQQEKLFSESRLMFKNCINISNEILRCEINLSKLDKAMLKIIIASSFDYLGLCYLQYTLFYEGQRCSIKADAFRQQSLNYFGDCIRVCEEIKELIESEGMLDYVPYYMWAQIAKENIARIVPKNVRGDKLKEVIKARALLIDEEKKKNDGNNYLLAHYPQLWLRICELVKSLLNCSSNSDIPSLISDNSIVSEIESEIKRAESAIADFEKLTNQYNSRKAVFADAKVCFLLSLNNVDEANNVAALYMKEAKNKNSGKAISILKNTVTRIESFVSYSKSVN